VRKYVFLLVLLLLLSGCGGGKKPKFTEEELAAIPFAQRTGLPKASGGFVLAVGGETITTDEIILPFIEDFRPFAQASDLEQFKLLARGDLEKLLIIKVSDILLYQEAKKDKGEQFDESVEKAVEEEIRKFVVSFEGDYARAEEALKQTGMDWRSFKEYQKKVVLTQSYIASQLPKARPITYTELVDAYNEMKGKYFSMEAMLKFRLIDVEVRELKVTDPNQDRRQFARNLADELMGQIQTGKDPGKLAEEHSGVSFIDHSEGVRPESLEEPYDVLAAEAEKIEPGQIAGPIEVGEHFFIMKLEEKQSKNFKPLGEVQGEIKETIMLVRRRQAVDRLTAKLVRQAALSNMDAFIDFCLEKIYRMSNQEIGE
jgi:hypothetical protein